MSEFIVVEVNQTDLKYVQTKLKNLQNKAPSAIRNAINRTATQAVKKIKSGRSAGYTIKAGEFNGEIKTQRATAGHLDATIKASGRPRTLKEYKYTYPKSGVKAAVLKGSVKALVRSGGGHAFVGTGGNISGLIAQRRTTERMDIRVPSGPSVPKMVEQIFKGKRGGQGDLEPQIRKTLHDEILAEIKKYA